MTTKPRRPRPNEAAIEETLAAAGRPMTAYEIVYCSGNRLPTKSAKPETVVSRDLAMEIIENGDDSVFFRTERGKYTLRSMVESES